eukprot:11884279-Ditylum_brightwellii.AAC.1
MHWWTRGAHCEALLKHGLLLVIGIAANFHVGEIGDRWGALLVQQQSLFESYAAVIRLVHVPGVMHVAALLPIQRSICHDCASHNYLFLSPWQGRHCIEWIMVCEIGDIAAGGQ